MRVISGEYRGRKLESPLDNEIRPTSDKVKEAVFSTLQFDVPDAICLDLFSGSGALGIEALSRGAKRVYFGDNSNESMALTKKNCKTCGCSEKSVFFLGDWKRVLSRVADEARNKVNIIFVDPPYKAGIYEDVLKEVKRLNLLAPDGVLVLEHEKRDVFPGTWQDYTLLKEKDYGKTTVSYYGVKQEEPSSPEA